jgi:hypothetical protein
MSAKDDFDLFHSVAEMLGLEEDETENFLTSAMRRRGHKPRIDWDDSESEGKESGGDFFSKKRETRQVKPSQRSEQRRSSSGGGWQYGA